MDAALWVHNAHPGLRIDGMVEACRSHGFNVLDSANFEVAQLLHEWGLADKRTRALTPAGAAFYDIWQARRREAVDILHGLQYQLWSRFTPEENPASWAYKTVCDTLWHTQVLPQPREFAAFVASRRMGEDPAPREAGQAFSAKSILDAYDWLLPLYPPVLLGVTRTPRGRRFRDAVFIRRAYCSASLFVMALAYLVREAGSALETFYPLGEAERERVCAACLLEPEAFDAMLTLAATTYGHLIAQQRMPFPAIALLRPVQVEDFR